MITACPDPQTLEELSSGQLPGPTSRDLANHVECCPQCAELISRLPDLPAQDWLVSELQRSSSDPLQLPQVSATRMKKVLARFEELAGEQVTRQEDPPTRPYIGARRQFGRFRVIEVLGFGGMGEVLLAEDPKLGRQVAIKVIRKDYCQDHRYRARLLREARAAGSLTHDHIVPVYDADECNGGCVMYQMATGRTPFSGPDHLAILHALANDAPASICKQNPAVPADLEFLILQLLDKRVENRPASAQAVAQCLAQLERQLESGSFDSPPRKSPAPRTGGKSRLRWRALVSRWSILPRRLLLLLGLAAIAGVALTVISIASRGGTLVVETVDPAVKIIVEGESTHVLDGKTNYKLSLKPGAFTVKLDGGKGLVLETKQFVLKRGGTEIVRIKWAALAKPSMTEREVATWALSVPGAPRVTLSTGQVLNAADKVPPGNISIKAINLAKTGVTDAGLAKLRSLNTLQDLQLGDTTIGDTGLEHVGEVKSLRDLMLNGTRILDQGLHHLKTLPLVHIDLSDTRIGDHGLELLQGHDLMESLALVGTKITDDGLRFLSGMKNLRILDLSRTNISDAGLVHLKSLSDLEQIELFESKVRGDGLVHLARRKHLWRLNLRATALRQGALEVLVDFPAVTELNLSGVQLSTDDLAPVARLPRLTHLDLQTTPVGNAGVALLANCPSLQTLILTNTRVTDQALEDLKRIKTLVKLVLHNVQTISDKGLKHIKDMPKLETLELDLVRSITDDGLKFLHSARQLKTLGLTKTGVTAAGIRSLKKALPGCAITP
ncbi:MAG: hypothetical protein FJ271_29270 [Planctomycetes bacterium]|nr:hypothetical protein [Planctomycetota bacterium]